MSGTLLDLGTANYALTYSPGGFSRDDRVARSNPLPKDTFVPGRFITFPGYINVPLISTNFPVNVLRVSQSATQQTVTGN